MVLNLPKVFYKPQTYRLDSSIVFLMVRNQLIFERIASKRLEGLEISASQMRVLMLIQELEEPTVSQIAAKLGAHPAAIVRTIDRLDKKNWIKRVRSDFDKRVIFLSVTPKAKSILEKIPPYLCDMLNQSLEGVSEDEFKTVQKVLKLIADNNLKLLEQSEMEVV